MSSPNGHHLLQLKNYKQQMYERSPVQDSLGQKHLRPWCFWCVLGTELLHPGFNREDTNRYLISKKATGWCWVAVINLPVWVSRDCFSFLETWLPKKAGGIFGSLQNTLHSNRGEPTGLLSTQAPAPQLSAALSHTPALRGLSFHL